MTKEDVQARLNAIGEKYGAAIMIEESENISVINEKYFTDVENLLRNGIRNSVNSGTYLLNDEGIDDIAVASSSLSQILLEDGVLYSGCFVETSEPRCLINWAVTSNPITYYVSAEPIIRDGNSNAMVKWFTPFSGNLKNPRFSYNGVFFYNFGEPIDDDGDGLLDLNSRTEHLEREFYGVKTEQTTPYM